MNQSRHSMFWRVWLRSLAVKRPQSLLAFAALALGAAVASLLLNLYGDAQRKMTSEFRAYGANVIVAPANSANNGPLGAAPSYSARPKRSRNESASSADISSSPTSGLIDAGTVARIQAEARALGSGDSPVLAFPVLYVVVSATPALAAASSSAPVSIVAVGADFAGLRALNPAWIFTPPAASERVADRASASALTSCVLGARAAERLGLALGSDLTLTAASADFQSQKAASSDVLTCRVTGLIASGKAEDDQAFVPLASLQKLSGLGDRASLIEMRVPASSSGIETAVKRLAETFPSLQVRPVREIVQSEGEILNTLRALVVSLAALIVGVVALCVMATVTTIVLERRKEVAVMKTLGATDRTVLSLLLTEIGALGLAGGAVGFVAGALLARRLGVDLFGVALHPAWWTLGPVMLTAVLVAALPALVPASIVRSIDPARSLRGE
jgi:putative ABC transport system permease protein